MRSASSKVFTLSAFLLWFYLDLFFMTMWFCISCSSVLLTIAVSFIGLAVCLVIIFIGIGCSRRWVTAAVTDFSEFCLLSAICELIFETIQQSYSHTPSKNCMGVVIPNPVGLTPMVFADDDETAKNLTAHMWKQRKAYKPTCYILCIYMHPLSVRPAYHGPVSWNLTSPVSFVGRQMKTCLFQWSALIHTVFWTRHEDMGKDISYRP
jgi:hypothetical protein